MVGWFFDFLLAASLFYKLITDVQILWIVSQEMFGKIIKQNT